MGIASTTTGSDAEEQESKVLSKRKIFESLDVPKKTGIKKRDKCKTRGVQLGLDVMPKRTG